MFTVVVARLLAAVLHVLCPLTLYWTAYTIPVGAFAGAVHEQIMPLAVIFEMVTAVGAPGTVPLATVLTVSVEEVGPLPILFVVLTVKS
jgi:hypothetical protein